MDSLGYLQDTEPPDASSQEDGGCSLPRHAAGMGQFFTRGRGRSWKRVWGGRELGAHVKCPHITGSQKSQLLLSQLRDEGDGMRS